MLYFSCKETKNFGLISSYMLESSIFAAVTRETDAPFREDVSWGRKHKHQSLKNQH